ncbi:MAG TPA: sulfatase [Candidatus Hydrogenedentes bacterium]|nr:sulfatase [Candidatus Hydrogenedentota bacterium]HOL77404.1 sulfatase [Candidatus Hydrogenedentota bacterium]
MNTKKDSIHRRRSRSWRLLAPIGIVICLFLAACTESPQKTTEVSTVKPSSEKTAVQTTTTPSKQNVVLIVIDSLRYDHVVGQRNQEPIMPKLQRFASKSWMYQRATTQATWTKPAVVSLFTSLYPAVHNTLYGVTVNLGMEQQPSVDGVPPNIPLMAEYLKEHGYTTIGIQTNANLNETSGINRGFDEYILKSYPYGDAHEATDLALDHISVSKTPFFLYLHYMDPHHPYKPPESYHHIFGEPPQLSDTDQELIRNFTMGYYLDKVFFQLGLKSSRQFGDISENGREYLKYMYAAESRYTDDEMERLLNWLEKNAPETTIIITADHGEEFWEHGSVGHSKTVYEELAHVPLLIRFPGKTPRIISRDVELIDILPTLAEHLRLPSHEHWQGRSLLSDPPMTHEPRPIFVETRGSLPTANLFLTAVRLEDYKLIVNRNTGDKTLYYLGKTGGETTPLSDEEKERQLYELLMKHFEDNGKHPLAGSTPTRTTLDDTAIQQLKSIGYLQ